MPAKTGEEYITGLTERPREVWMRDEQVKDVNLFPHTIYPRMAEIIQLLGSGSLMALPAEADFETSIGPEVERYLATDSASAREKARVYHLAWDIACSAFGGRQVLYERFFGGDPVRNAMLMYNSYDREPAMQRVREFLHRGD